MQQSWIPTARLIRRLSAAVVCVTLAHRTFIAMRASKPWWLRHASDLAIRGLAVNLVDGSKETEKHGFFVHVAVNVLGWALDEMLTSQSIGGF